MQIILKSVIKLKRKEACKIERKSCKVLNLFFLKHKYLVKNNIKTQFNRNKMLKYCYVKSI